MHMADRSHAPAIPGGKLRGSALGWARTNLFGGIGNTIITLLCIALLVSLVPPMFNWAVTKATFLGASAEDCTGTGACWVYFTYWRKVIFYGQYPADLLWRPNLVGLVGMLLIVPVAFPVLTRWRRFFIVALVVVYPVAATILLRGGILGLDLVDTEKWGGLTLTLFLAVVVNALSLPVATLLALGRRSQLPLVRAVCVTVIELVRGVPLISILFMASVMLPFLFPEGMNFNKLVRVILLVTLFAGTYLAETIRGGLNSLPRGQYEAAQALGLGYWRMQYLVILPQAYRVVLPGMVNSFVGLLKGTSLVLIIGMFDVLGTIQAINLNPDWTAHNTEGYVIAAAIFWIFSFSISQYARWIETRKK